MLASPRQNSMSDSLKMCAVHQPPWPHAWEQGESGKAIEKKAFDALRNPVRMRKFGIPST